ncbi:hypothetical protein D3C72_1481400 [compost metagenome]
MSTTTNKGGRPQIPVADLAFAYELRCQGLSWKAITRHVSWERTALIKGIARRMI